MKLFGFTISRGRQPPVRTYDLTDEDREAAVAARQRKSYMKKLEQEMEILTLEAEKADLEYRIYGDEEEDAQNPDMMLMQLFSKIMGGQSMTAPASTTSSFTSPQPPEPSDDQLRAMKAKIPPKVLKIAKKMSDEQIREYARLNYPDLLNFSEKTQEKALKILREE